MARNKLKRHIRSSSVRLSALMSRNGRKIKIKKPKKCKKKCNHLSDIEIITRGSRLGGVWK